MRVSLFVYLPSLKLRVCVGTVELDLHGFPRGAKTAKSCKLDMLMGGNETISIFQQKRTRGWWPFTKSGELTVRSESPTQTESGSVCLIHSSMVSSSHPENCPSRLWAKLSSQSCFTIFVFHQIIQTKVVIKRQKNVKFQKPSF